MKTIGSTDEGNYLVEMSREEHRSFAFLASALTGRIWEIWDTHERQRVDTDLVGAFSAIYLFANVLERHKRLEDLVAEFKSVLLPKEMDAPQKDDTITNGHN